MRSCCAVYVDVGYLLAAAATRVTGSSLRRGVQADYASLISWLAEHAQADSGLPLLRINWYDAGARPGGQPDQSQDDIGRLPAVKLRLGRLSYSGEQKGVDVRIGLDLAIQARHRVADVVYLVSGDDDLTEAVEEAQSHGVQVVLLAVPRHDEQPLAVSKHLLREVDHTQVIAQDAIDAAFKPTAIPEALVPAPYGEDETATDEERFTDDEEPTTAADTTQRVGSGGTPPSGDGTGERTEDTTDARDSAGTETSSGTESGGIPLPGPPRTRKRTVRVHAEGGPDASAAPSPGSAPDPAAKADATAAPAREEQPDDAPAAAPSPALFAKRKANAVLLPGGTPTPPPAASPETGPSMGLIDAVAAQVVVAWCSSATPDSLTELRAAEPVIPAELDRALLVDLAARSDDGDLDDTTRHLVRSRFWHHIGRVRPV